MTEGYELVVQEVGGRVDNHGYESGHAVAWEHEEAEIVLDIAEGTCQSPQYPELQQIADAASEQEAW